MFLAELSFCSACNDFVASRVFACVKLKVWNRDFTHSCGFHIFYELLASSTFLFGCTFHLKCRRLNFFSICVLPHYVLSFCSNMVFCSGRCWPGLQSFFVFVPEARSTQVISRRLAVRRSKVFSSTTPTEILTHFLRKVSVLRKSPLFFRCFSFW